MFSWHIILVEFTLKVFFVGEDAVDTGGPLREFWRLIMQELSFQFCIGNDKNKVLVHSVPALQVRVLPGIIIILYTLLHLHRMVTSKLLVRMWRCL